MWEFDEGANLWINRQTGQTSSNMPADATGPSQTTAPTRKKYGAYTVETQPGESGARVFGPLPDTESGRDALVQQARDEQWAWDLQPSNMWTGPDSPGLYIYLRTAMNKSDAEALQIASELPTMGFEDKGAGGQFMVDLTSDANRDKWLATVEKGTGAALFEEQIMPLAERQLAMQERLAGGMMDIAKTQEQRAQERYNLYKQTYLPREEAFVEETFRAPPIMPEVARARATVRQTFDPQQQEAERQLQRLGIDPSSPKYAEALRTFDLARAAAEAGAANETRRNLFAQQWAKKRDVLGTFGRGIPSEAAAMAASGIPAMTGASGATASGAGTFLNAAGSGMGMYNDWAKLGWQGAEAEEASASTERAAMYGGLGNFASAFVEPVTRWLKIK